VTDEPLTTAQHIDQAKAALAGGATEYAIAHALIALAEIGAANLLLSGALAATDVDEPLVSWSGAKP
jgi:hypothetical protein